MSIDKVKVSFKSNEISKLDFIAKMHEFHKVLLDFSDSLIGTEISKIEIEDSSVIFVSRQTAQHLGGVKFIVDVIDKQSSPINAFNFGQYERQDSEVLYKLIDHDDVIFDIGANVGWYANHFSKTFPNAKIYAFEPVPDIFDQLNKNTELNCSKNIILHMMAFLDKKGKSMFYYSPAITGASSLINITEDYSMINVDCEVDTIDHFVRDQKISKLDFIKCDVEGSELFVYKGGLSSIKHFKPIIFTEMLRKWSAKFNYHPNDILDLFKGLGYCCYVAQNEKLILINSVTDETVETNFFFMHQVKHQDKINMLV